MKYVYLIFVFLIALSCVHKKRIVVNRLEGKWALVKRLNADGSYTQFNNVILEFAGGKADGKTYLDLTRDSAGIVTKGNYLVSKNGAELFMNYDLSNPNSKDSTIIEDMDKKSLIVRNFGIVLFFEKN